jgi:two-component system chemotaxis response regulator CheB
MSHPLIRVLVVDDSAFLRGVLPAKIESDPRFKVVGTAVDGRDAVEKTLALKPDVVTLDIDMPVMNGLDALREIVRQSTASVIMLSARTEQGAAITLEALALGAVDFIPKSRGVDRIHEKLLAAVEAKAQKSRVSAPKPAAVVRPTAPSRAAAGVRVNAKICIIGSSTGGPQALQAVISQLPETLPVPLVVAAEMTKLHKLGGYNISQDQASCVVYGMPRTLVEQGGANEVLPLDQIGPRIRSALGC